MGVRILHDDAGEMSALYCSTTGVAFGPVIEESQDEAGDHHDSVERAEAFLRWLPADARTYTDAQLMARYSDWRAQESAQWIREKSEEDAKYRWIDEEAAK
jgi:hypothetical protein